MDSKRKSSQEKEACRKDGKKKKVVRVGNQGAGGSSGDGLIDVPIMSWDERVFGKDVSIGSWLKPTHTSDEGLARDLSLAKNESVQVHANIEAQTNKIKDKGKGKAIIVIDEASCPIEDTVSTIFEKNGEEKKNCVHFWIWKQGIGHVCWICDIIDDKKHPLLPPGFGSGSSKSKDIRMQVPLDGISGTGIFLDPWHKNLMEPHHMEMLNFICSNLAVYNPNGCIIAQAPVSEKTFLMICFINSYLSRHPNGKPLFLLPKWMIEFWKKEFDRLKVTDITLLDFYSSKERSQHLGVLNQWLTTRSILFVGHKHFTNMISKVEGDFRDILLNTPSIVIFDRGTGPLNDMMKLISLVARINTPQRILLTGTLHQSHIREIFQLLNVIFPDFFKHNKPGQKIKRLLDVDGPSTNAMQIPIPLVDKLEETILSQDTDHADKIGYLTELRMLTNKFIYNHRGEFLPEASSLMDFTVVLKPSSSQKSAWDTEKNAKSKGFKTYSTLSGITLHPALLVFSDRLKSLPAPKNDEMDAILKDINVEDGVKTKFMLGLVKLCGYTNEKILVVSQYVIPLIFLQRLLAKVKGWQNGKETFMLKGDTRAPAREIAINQFNNSPDAKVFFASIKSCGEHINITGATRVILLDINSSLCLVRQAIELTYQPGQQNKVYSYRLVTADTSEEEEDIIAATKEMVGGVWLDGKSYPVDGKFQIPTIEGKYANDYFLGASYMKDDIKTIYKR